MFGRWIKLLFVLLVVTCGVTYYFIDRQKNAWSVSDECMQYLNRLDSSWVSATDSYYQSTCALDNPWSSASVEMSIRNRNEGLVGQSLLVAGALFLLILFSVVLRWLFTGRIR